MTSCLWLVLMPASHRGAFARIDSLFRPFWCYHSVILHLLSFLAGLFPFPLAASCNISFFMFLPVPSCVELLSLFIVLSWRLYPRSCVSVSSRLSYCCCPYLPLLEFLIFSFCARVATPSVVPAAFFPPFALLSFDFIQSPACFVSSHRQFLWGFPPSRVLAAVLFGITVSWRSSIIFLSR